MSVLLDELEHQLDDLRKVKVFNTDVEKGAEDILARAPAPVANANKEEKIRLLLIRGRARLLLPAVSKEAEQDLHAVLKLRPNSPDVWVELSECLLRRNALKEACDALDNALRVDPANVEALCRYSQLDRNRCGEPGTTAAQKAAFLADAVQKARAAVSANVSDADAWNTLSLSLLSKATAEGVDVDGVRRALAAMQQAENKAPDDPDVHFNKGILNSLMAHFGDAAVDFLRARELDSHRLKGTKRLCEDNVALLQRTQTRVKNVTKMGKRELKKLCDSVTTAVKKAAGTPAASYTHVSVVDVVSEPTMQPLTVLAVNERGEFDLELLYEVASTSIKIGDVLAYPSSEALVAVTHTVPAIPFLDSEAFTVVLQHHYTNLKTILLNGRPLPRTAYVPLQMSSRLFA